MNIKVILDPQTQTFLKDEINGLESEPFIDQYPLIMKLLKVLEGI